MPSATRPSPSVVAQGTQHPFESRRRRIGIVWRDLPEWLPVVVEFCSSLVFIGHCEGHRLRRRA